MSERPTALDRLDVLVGEWTVAPDFPDSDLSGMTGTVGFEWVLDRQYLLQRSEAPDPIPDSLSVIAYDAERDAFTQHYFDSRGVTRIYEMTFDGHTWTLARGKPDFSAFEFAQRFTGTLEDDGRTIRGRWEKRFAGADWELDFELIYTKVG